MYSNVGALIKQKAMWRMRVMPWIVTAVLSWPLYELLFFHIYRMSCYLSHGRMDVDTLTRFMEMYNFSLVGIVENLIIRVFGYGIMETIIDVILYPIENIMRIIVFGLNRPISNPALYFGTLSIIQVGKIVILFFIVRSWLKHKYMRLYAFGDTVENSTEITKKMLRMRKRPVTVPGVGVYRLESDRIVCT